MLLTSIPFQSNGFMYMARVHVFMASTDTFLKLEIVDKFERVAYVEEYLSGYSEVCAAVKRFDRFAELPRDLPSPGYLSM